MSVEETTIYQHSPQNKGCRITVMKDYKWDNKNVLIRDKTNWKEIQRCLLVPFYKNVFFSLFPWEKTLGPRPIAPSRDMTPVTPPLPERAVTYVRCWAPQYRRLYLFMYVSYRWYLVTDLGRLSKLSHWTICVQQDGTELDWLNLEANPWRFL